jgi:hypothetical protein
MTPNFGQSCGAKKVTRPEGWTLLRFPVCNRPAGHSGPHCEYGHDAEIRAEWGSTS